MAKKGGVPNDEATRFKPGAEQVEIARQGGIASGESKRKKKLFKEEIERQLGDKLESIIASMINQAETGNVQAGVFLRDTIGEKPKEQLEADVGIKEIRVDIEDE